MAVEANEDGSVSLTGKHLYLVSLACEQFYNMMVEANDRSVGCACAQCTERRQAMDELQEVWRAYRSAGKAKQLTSAAARVAADLLKGSHEAGE